MCCKLHVACCKVHVARYYCAASYMVRVASCHARGCVVGFVWRVRCVVRRKLDARRHGRRRSRRSSGFQFRRGGRPPSCSRSRTASAMSSRQPAAHAPRNVQRWRRSVHRATRSAELTRYACNMQHGTCNAQLLRAARLPSAARCSWHQERRRFVARGNTPCVLRCNYCAADEPALQTQRNASCCERGCAAEFE